MSLLVGWVSGFCVVFGFRFCVADRVVCLRILLYCGGWYNTVSGFRAWVLGCVWGGLGIFGDLVIRVFLGCDFGGVVVLMCWCRLGCGFFGFRPGGFCAEAAVLVLLFGFLVGSVWFWVVLVCSLMSCLLLGCCVDVGCFWVVRLFGTLLLWVWFCGL